VQAPSPYDWHRWCPREGDRVPYLGRVTASMRALYVFHTRYRGTPPNVVWGDEQTDRLLSASAARSKAPQGRCAWPQLDRAAHCGGLFVSDEHGRTWPTTPCDCRLCERSLRRKPAAPSAPNTAGWPASSAAQRVAAGQASHGVRPWVVAVSGRAGRGTGHCRHGPPGDPTKNAKQHGLTPRQMPYWVIPPEATGACVACRANV
jgi:hypothetical protein